MKRQQKINQCLNEKKVSIMSVRAFCCCSCCIVSRRWSFFFHSRYDLCTGNTLTRLILFCISLVSDNITRVCNTIEAIPWASESANNQSHRVQFGEQTDLWKNWKFNRMRSNRNGERKTQNVDLYYFCEPQSSRQFFFSPIVACFIRQTTINNTTCIAFSLGKAFHLRCHW